MNIVAEMDPKNTAAGMQRKGSVDELVLAFCERLENVGLTNSIHCISSVAPEDCRIDFHPTANKFAVFEIRRQPRGQEILKKDKICHKLNTCEASPMCSVELELTKSPLGIGSITFSLAGVPLAYTDSKVPYEGLVSNTAAYIEMLRTFIKGFDIERCYAGKFRKDIFDCVALPVYAFDSGNDVDATIADALGNVINYPAHFGIDVKTIRNTGKQKLIEMAKKRAVSIRNWEGGTEILCAQVMDGFIFRNGRAIAQWNSEGVAQLVKKL